MMLMIMVQIINHFKIVGYTLERPGKKEMQIDHQYQLQMMNSLFQTNILIIFGDLLICH